LCGATEYPMMYRCLMVYKNLNMRDHFDLQAEHRTLRFGSPDASVQLLPTQGEIRFNLGNPFRLTYTIPH